MKKNLRALFVPCGAHTVNLVVADAAKSSADATTVFYLYSEMVHLKKTCEHNPEVLV